MYLPWFMISAYISKHKDSKCYDRPIKVQQKKKTKRYVSSDAYNTKNYE